MTKQLERDAIYLKRHFDAEIIVARNNSRSRHFGIRHLQTRADSGMMSACYNCRDQLSELSRIS